MGKTRGNSYHTVHVQEQCDTWLNASTAAKVVPAKKKVIQRKTPVSRSAQGQIKLPLLDISWASQPVEIKATRQSNITKFFQKKLSGKENGPSIETYAQETSVCPADVAVMSGGSFLQSHVKNQFNLQSSKSTVTNCEENQYSPSSRLTNDQGDASPDMFINDTAESQMFTKDILHFDHSVNFKSTLDESCSLNSCSSMKTFPNSLELFSETSSEQESTDSIDTILTFKDRSRFFSERAGQLNREEKRHGITAGDISLQERVIGNRSSKKDMKELNLSDLRNSAQNKLATLEDSESVNLTFHSYNTPESDLQAGMFSISSSSDSSLTETFHTAINKQSSPACQTEEIAEEESEFTPPRISQFPYKPRNACPADTLLLFSQEKENYVSPTHCDNTSRSKGVNGTVYTTGRSHVFSLHPQQRAKSKLVRDTDLGNEDSIHLRTETLALDWSQEKISGETTNCDVDVGESSDTGLLDSLTFHSLT